MRTKRLNRSFLAWASLLLFLPFSCTKDTDGNNPSNPSGISITTSDVTFITSSSAASGGSISTDGGSAVTLRGICWSTTTNPDTADFRTKDSSGIGSFTSQLTGLSANTKYFVRAYAINAKGLAYGNEKTGTTATGSCPDSMTDIDGNVYPTVRIGDQCWTKTNLKTSRYKNGDSIPTALSNSTWASTDSGSFAILQDLPANNDTYGKLYNFYAVTDTRGLCPAGWHVPSDAEWTTMEHFLGGIIQAGGKLKAVSNLWDSPNTGATDGSGFSALPGGSRSGTSGGYTNSGGASFFWSSTEYTTDDLAYSRLLNSTTVNSYRTNFSKRSGFSVRCISN